MFDMCICVFVIRLSILLYVGTRAALREDWFLTQLCRLLCPCGLEREQTTSLYARWLVELYMFWAIALTQSLAKHVCQITDKTDVTNVLALSASG